MRVLMTGAAGFIGTHLRARLIAEGHRVVGLDDFTPYYSPDLKSDRQELVGGVPDILRMDLTQQIEDAAVQEDVGAVVHLAAQPGVRLPVNLYSRYVDANLVALNRVLEFAARRGVPVLYASSSSVYGDGTPTPFAESAGDLVPTSFYGATKLAGEHLARSYCRSAGIAARGMRYFTVYGPWGRPDMAYFRLIAAGLGEWDFTLTGTSTIRRDFTYIDDTVTSTIALLMDLLQRPAGHHDVVNVGGGQSRTMGDLISVTAEATGQSLKVNQGASVAADMAATEADFGLLQHLTHQHPSITLEEGIERCFSWASRPDIRPRLRAWIESTQ